MAKPSAPGLQVRRWPAGRWTESTDAVVTEEPLQLMLEGKPLSVVMRTPGQDLELCLGLMFAEGIVRALDEAPAGYHHIASLRTICSAGTAWSAHVKQRLLELERRPPVVITSAHWLDEQDIGVRGYEGVIRKPFDIEEFARQVAAYLEAREEPR